MTQPKPGIGRCEVCGKTLICIGYSRCAAHATPPPAEWKLKMLKPVQREADLGSWDRDVEAQRA